MTQFRVRDFTSAELNCKLGPMALAQKHARALGKRVKIMLSRIRMGLNLFHAGLTCLLCPFTLIVLQLAIVGNLADRGIGVGLHLDEIKALLSGKRLSFAGGHNAQLCAIQPDQSYEWHSDSLVGPGGDGSIKPAFW